MKILVTTDDFDLTTEVNALRENQPQIGAVVSFVGLVRDINHDHSVSCMELEHYPAMTEKSLQEIITTAQQRWQIIDATIIHRVGKLSPCDQIVLVAIASMHRGDAFAACEFIMDYLKTRAPFWKKEHTPNGAHWVDARESDELAQQRWSKPAPH
ncbi:molybdopterin synthase catalytic subunit MoaE [Sulfuriferula nivalis]|uniref:Molybdopterin synthase catalytic subunit n=1 Tax=Sulfuriferula nivalis TaxID=2675298 RepID=A0A809S852_9PROT|nr:molybdopterin synthase catalytic subunit MoaE [Sulfuriferula nivalis]BBO99991.1 molybdopterin converting factor subunit 2 [Sulfuriferula nivalis]